MKWILISAAYILMILSFVNCEETNGLNLEITPPEKTPPASLNEISKDDNIDYSFGGAVGDDVDAIYEFPSEENHSQNNDNNDDNDNFKTLKPDDYKFNPHLTIEDDDNDENKYRAIFLTRFLEPENLKALQERLKRHTNNDNDDDDDKSSKITSNSESQSSVPLPDDENDNGAGRFLQT